MIVLRDNNLYGNYRNRKFSDVWGDVESFVSDYNDSQIPEVLTETNLTTLYYLLYARYGNSTIASSDENQFKYKIFSNIFMYGPAWQKRLEMQDAVMKLNISEVQKDGGKVIYNSASNPSVEPQNDSTEALPYINQQNTSNYIKSKVDSIAVINELINTDVTEYFLSTFKKFFLTVVSPELPLWYVTNLLNQEEDNDDN